MKKKYLIDNYGLTSDDQLRKLAIDIGININYIGFAENIKKPLTGLNIINLGDHQIGGTHWTSVYVNGKNSFYYDSFAAPPEDILLKYLPKNVIYNDYFQSQDINEELCGIWALVFLKNMSTLKKNASLNEIFNKFKEFTLNFKDLN